MKPNTNKLNKKQIELEQLLANCLAKSDIWFAEKSTKTTKYAPKLATLKLLKLVNHHYNNSERNFYLSSSYRPVTTSQQYDEYAEFSVVNIFKHFNETEIAFWFDQRYKNEKCGFVSKEDCQTYCNWLNNNKLVE